MTENNFKSGFITIAGRPNAGKSTLLNRLVGEKVSITSPKPQTTRNKITGIMTGDGYQAVFIDTPGINRFKNKMGEYMQRSIESAFDGVDIVVYVIAADKHIDRVDKEYVTKYADGKKPFILVINKCDAVRNPEEVPFKIEQFAGNENITAIIPLSALKDKKTDILREEIIKHLKEGEQFFPEDMITDKNMRFMAAEIIREKALLYLAEEVPHGVGVAINKYEEREDGLVLIDADLVCEKKAHKPIIIGKDGAMLKKISTAARLEIERLAEAKVYLNVWVRIKDGWRDDQNVLDLLGYNKKDI